MIRFFGYYDYLLAAIMVSALIANAALYFVYRCCELFLPSSKALLALLLGIPLIAFAPWMVNPYSDTMTLLFPIFSLFCFLKAETLNSKSVSYTHLDVYKRQV